MLRFARNDRKKMKKAFTLIELLVAMAVLALMIAFASMVFTVSIDTYRVSAATAEIMQKLRVVTDQLDADFKGLRKDAPLLMWFQLDAQNRYDQIMFFADGDFSSIQLYTQAPDAGQPDSATGDAVVRGNTARVFYGQTNLTAIERNRILARRQHILTADTNVDNWPQYNAGVLTNFDTTRNEWYEHDRLSLANWKIVSSSDIGSSVIPVCFDSRPRINTNADYHKLLCEGLGSFSIQFAYWDSLNGNDRFYWFPSTDPDGADGPARSHFVLRVQSAFGVYFNVPAPDIADTDWGRVNSVAYQSGQTFAPDFFPAAIKFTFKLYDSNGVIKDGMEFSHIVYLEK